MNSSNLIFIHIPKNAGTSIGKTLGINNPTHRKAFEYLSEYGKEFFEDKFVFGVVRNPFDRFISLYNYSRMEVSYYHNNIYPDNSRFGKHCDFEILKNASVYECAQFLKEGLLKHDFGWNHWKPQYTWLYDQDEKLLINKFYKIENLNPLKRDLMKLGIKINDFPRLNSSNSKGYENLIDRGTQSILESYYCKDLELFDYEF